MVLKQYTKQNGQVLHYVDTEILLEQGELLTDIAIQASPEAVSALKLQVEAAADSYHKQFLGAETTRRELRFNQNLVMAEEVIAGTASAETIQSLTLQANAQARKSGDATATMDINAFAQWIVAWKEKSRLIASAIEQFIVDGKTAIDALENPHLESVQAAFLADIKARAGAEFTRLTR